MRCWVGDETISARYGACADSAEPGGWCDAAPAVNDQPVRVDHAAIGGLRSTSCLDSSCSIHDCADSHQISSVGLIHVVSLSVPALMNATPRNRLRGGCDRRAAVLTEQQLGRSAAASDRIEYLERRALDIEAVLWHRDVRRVRRAALPLASLAVTEPDENWLGIAGVVEVAAQAVAADLAHNGTCSIEGTAAPDWRLYSVAAACHARGLRASPETRRWRSGEPRLQARLATSSQVAPSPSVPDEGAAFNGWTRSDEGRRKCPLDHGSGVSPPVRSKKRGDGVENRRGGAPEGAPAGNAAGGAPSQRCPSCFAPDRRSAPSGATKTRAEAREQRQDGLTIRACFARSRGRASFSITICNRNLETTT